MMNQRQQPVYDPMGQMMQILQLIMGQNQQAQQQQNQDRNFGLEQQQLDMRGEQFNQSHAQQAAIQQAEQEWRRQQATQQQTNADRAYGLDERQFGVSQKQLEHSLGMDQKKFDLAVKQFDQQAAHQDAIQKQQIQQAIMAALSRNETQDGFQDPRALYQYLEQLGISLPAMQPPPPSAAELEKAAAVAKFNQMLQ